MPQPHVIEIPGVGNVEFPASMSDADMSAAAAKLYADHQGPTRAEAPPTRGVRLTPELTAAAAEIDKRQAADAERDQNWPADFASKLPRALQSPVAMGLSMIQPAAEIAGVVSAAPSALKAGRAVSEALSKPADTLIDLLLKKIGHDPDALELAATKMRLQAARSQTRQGRIAADIAAKTATTSSAPAASVAPAETVPAVAAPVAAAPVPAAPPVPPTVPPSLQSEIAAPSPAGPSPAAAALPDQRALNEAALAVRRQAYQERLKAQTAAQVAEAAPPAPTPAAAANVKLSAAETTAFLDLMKRGMSGPDAMKNVLLQRELVASLGTPTPTAAQTRFPKGFRGKQP